MSDDLQMSDIPPIGVSREAEHEIHRHRPTIHRWWARRPSSYARAAVYRSLSNRNDQNRDFLRSLCSYPPDPEVLVAATRKVLERHAVELSQETGRSIDAEDIQEGRVRRPRVLDQFSGSGSIPLEALRLGCEAVAVDLNPVAYLIQLCGLYFPQKFGEAAAKAIGSASDGTWAGLAKEIEVWGEGIQERVSTDLRGVYPLVSYSSSEDANTTLTPEVYLWARSVQCSDPDCGATVPLVQQPWLSKRRGEFVALRPGESDNAQVVNYKIVESDGREALGLDPRPSIERGEAICPFCSSCISRDHIREEGRRGRLGTQLLAVICRDERGNRRYLSRESMEGSIPSNKEIHRRIQNLCEDTGLGPPNESFADGSMSLLSAYGFRQYSDLFTPRQLLTLLTYTKYIVRAYGQMVTRRYETERAKAVVTCLALALGKLVDLDSSLSTWDPHLHRVRPTYMRHAPSMTWNFSELDPRAISSPYLRQVDELVEAVDQRVATGLPAQVSCASAMDLPFEDQSFDAVVTDLPYYDNVPYADLSDFFYIWIKRTVGHLYPHEFSCTLTSKQKEITTAPHHPRDDDEDARSRYEQMMEDALGEAARVLKPGRQLSVFTYSHDADELQSFLQMARKAGLELFDAGKIQPERTESSRGYPLLLTFKKSKFRRQISEMGPRAEAVLRLVERGQSPLYNGLIKLLLRCHPPDDSEERDALEESIPEKYVGSLETRLREYVADYLEDPREVLRELLGRTGCIKAVRKLPIEEMEVREPMSAEDRILQFYGFTVPDPPSDGTVATIARLKELTARLRQARDKVALRGPLNEGMNLVEKTLRDAAWAWGYAMLGESRDEHFARIVKKKLDRLAMGDVVRLYCELPYHVVDESGQQFIDRAVELFDKPHPYAPKGYEQYLRDRIVALRNKVEHNKENYLTRTSVPDMRTEFIEGLRLAREKLQELFDKGALPRIVRPIRKTVDMYGRWRVELQVEDGTSMDIYVTDQLCLGSDYFLFPAEGNPYPVDPPMFLRSDVMGDEG